MIHVTPSPIPDLLILKQKIFADERGFLFESFNQRDFQEATGLDTTFVQDNYTYSTKNVLRGMHYQLPPLPQGKLVRALQGTIYDVCIDLRASSPTYGEWASFELTAENAHQLWVPPGFAHGFMVLSESAHVMYKATTYYAPEQERCIAWNDPTLAIKWPGTEKPITSPKDKQGVLFKQAEVFS